MLAPTCQMKFTFSEPCCLAGFAVCFRGARREMKERSGRMKRSAGALFIVALRNLCLYEPMDHEARRSVCSLHLVVFIRPAADDRKDVFYWACNRSTGGRGVCGGGGVFIVSVSPMLVIIVDEILFSFKRFSMISIFIKEMSELENLPSVFLFLCVCVCVCICICVNPLCIQATYFLYTLFK